MTLPAASGWRAGTRRTFVVLAEGGPLPPSFAPTRYGLRTMRYCAPPDAAGPSVLDTTDGAVFVADLDSPAALADLVRTIRETSGFRGHDVRPGDGRYCDEAGVPQDVWELDLRPE